MSISENHVEDAYGRLGCSCQEQLKVALISGLSWTWLATHYGSGISEVNDNFIDSPVLGIIDMAVALFIEPTLWSRRRKY